MDNIRVDLDEITDLAQDMDYWRAIVNAAYLSMEPWAAAKKTFS